MGQVNGVVRLSALVVSSCSADLPSYVRMRFLFSLALVYPSPSLHPLPLHALRRRGAACTVRHDGAAWGGVGGGRAEKGENGKDVLAAKNPKPLSQRIARARSLLRARPASSVHSHTPITLSSPCVHARALPCPPSPSRSSPNFGPLPFNSRRRHPSRRHPARSRRPLLHTHPRTARGERFQQRPTRRRPPRAPPRSPQHFASISTSTRSARSSTAVDVPAGAGGHAPSPLSLHRLILRAGAHTRGAGAPRASAVPQRSRVRPTLPPPHSSRPSPPPPCPPRPRPRPRPRPTRARARARTAGPAKAGSPVEVQHPG
jgi:hypothetical protein